MVCSPRVAADTRVRPEASVYPVFMPTQSSSNHKSLLWLTKVRPSREMVWVAQISDTVGFSRQAQASRAMS